MADRSNLAKRVTVAVLFGPLLLVLFWLGGMALILGIGVIAGIGTWEYCCLQERKGLQPWKALGIVASSIWCLWIGVLGPDQVLLPLSVLLVILLTLAIWTRGGSFRMADSIATMHGFLYVGFLSSFAILLRNFPPHQVSEVSVPFFSILVLVTIWVSDITAYFFGGAFGHKHPFPQISPGKTVVGFVAGFAGAMAAVAVSAFQQQPLDSFPALLGLGVIVGVGGQLGDLVESMVKRDAGVKDSSRILPGHGGILDRFDSFLFAFPLAYVYLSVIGAGGP